MKDKSWAQHQQDVNDISWALQEACAERTSVDWCRGANKLPHATRKSKKNSSGRVINAGSLNGMLGLDGGCVWVEPGVTMEQLCRWTLSRGLIPPVVPEFKGITVGGAVMGAGLESSSFHEGQFSDSCEAYELILANGQVLQASPEQHSELFYGVSGSYGSIATLALAKVRVVPAKPFVRLTYRVIEGHEHLTSGLEELCQLSLRPDYVDGIVLDERRAVLIAGYQTPEIPSGVTSTTFDAFWKPWFIQHVLEKAKQATIQDDFVPIWDYLFRFDRGAFWMGQFVTNWRSLTRYLTRYRLSSPHLRSYLQQAEALSPPNLSPGLLFRAAFGWMFSSRSMYRVLHHLPSETLANKYIVQDFYVPIKALGTFLSHLKRNVVLYPLWICPMRGSQNDQFLSPHLLTTPTQHPLPDFVNVGVYGVPANGREIPEVTRELESLVHELGGRKMLYAVNSIPEEEFWQVYNRKRYEELRAVSGSGVALREFYDKTHGNMEASSGRR